MCKSTMSISSDTTCSYTTYNSQSSSDSDSSSEPLKASSYHEDRKNTRQRVPPKKKSTRGKSSSLQAAKAQLQSILKAHGGSTKHPDVVAAIEKLLALKQHQQPKQRHYSTATSCDPLLLGDFLADTAPDFSGRIKGTPKDVIQYTLGKLSFGMFQPRTVPCTVRTVRNSMEECHDPELVDEFGVDGVLWHYDLYIDVTIHNKDGNDFDAVLCHNALAYPVATTDDSNTTRVGVIFRGGSLTPHQSVTSNAAQLQAWNDCFGPQAHQEHKAQQSFLTNALQRAMELVFAISVHHEPTKAIFTMNRSPRGHLDVLYIDEELRITRGNRGTLVVVKRMTDDVKVEGK